MEVKKITVFGKNYTSAPELRSDHCLGCAFVFDKSGGCEQAVIQFGCGGSGIIWNEEPVKQATATPEKTFTLAQVTEALNTLDHHQSTIDQVIKYLSNSVDPEYTKYIELKKKFGDQ